jgi:hypothetical protein
LFQAVDALEKLVDAGSRKRVQHPAQLLGSAHNIWLAFWRRSQIREAHQQSWRHFPHETAKPATIETVYRSSRQSYG